MLRKIKGKGLVAVNIATKIPKTAKAGLLLLGTSVSAMADSIIPDDLATNFADGTTDIKTIIGLIFGIIVTLYVFKVVKSTFSK